MTPTPAPDGYQQREASGYPLLSLEAVGQRHPVWMQMHAIWRYYRDMYEGGVAWAGKLNPLQAQAMSQPSIAGEIAGGGGFVAEANPMGGAHGMVRYLWQNPLEKDVKYRHRLARAFYVNILAPVVDFYAATISKTDNVSYDGDPVSDEFFNNVDMQKQSYLQFMTTARTNAAVAGHTFILCDSSQAQGEVVTARDVAEQGIRPYLVEILPEHMLNWRLDRNGQPLEILYSCEGEVPGTIATVQKQSASLRYYYWTRQYWQIYEEQQTGARAGDTTLVLVGEGDHPLGRIPLAVLYHKRCQAFAGEPLIKDSAKIGHILSNWASALDESFEGQMFAMPVLTSKKTPADVGVGSTIILHLNPDEGETFAYVSPDTAPFSQSWDAFYRLVELANKHMGIAPSAVGSGKVDAKSGVSKAWDFFESEKILSRMAGNEQDVADELFTLAALWDASVFKGTVSYKTKFDLSTAEDDINDLISLQSAGVPATARREMMRQVVFKKLPNLPDDTRDKINAEVDAMAKLPDMAVPPGAPGGPPAPPAPAPPILPVAASRPVDRPGRPLVAPGSKATAA